MTETTTVKVTITQFGETRDFEVEGYLNWNDRQNPEREGLVRMATIHGLVGTIGNGSARYPTALLLHRLYDGQSPKMRGTVVTDQLGRTFTYHLGTCIRNRQARIVGWTDKAGKTNDVDQTRR